jgi:hypothetical protein
VSWDDWPLYVTLALLPLALARLWLALWWEKRQERRRAEVKR